ncbi:baseplate J/gp47 family protein [Vibrio brasiliensis]|uniref:baseplate J/gp47 family protein n=1 Tax=Vibrio brasiliensis TaxID=170652 RepID=UPI001EFDC3B4|nr:baseplate J/gp47 family protein [Vibrio brasiliensis]MCG9785392.1 baseplate J/gp47 family protein [Vibrio brasiliensis]
MSQVPEILTVKPFGELREQFIEEFFIPHATEQVGEEKAQQIAAGLRSPNEVSALLLDCIVLYRQQETRNDNHKALQEFSETVVESQMIDLIVKRYANLTRQIIEPADNTVFPPKAAVMESDESLLLRYSLAPYGLATTGTRMGYRFHALTLGEQPLITVEVESDNVIIQRFEFVKTDGLERPKDAQARMTEAFSGKIELRLLSFAGDGSASQALCDSVLGYCSRDDIGQESNTLTVKSAQIQSYTIDIEVTEYSEPNQLIDRAALDKALQDYAKEQHKLGGAVKLTRIYQIAHNHKAVDITINQPEADINCTWQQAPYCTGVTSLVQPKQTTQQVAAT